MRSGQEGGLRGQEAIKQCWGRRGEGAGGAGHSGGVGMGCVAKGGMRWLLDPTHYARI